MHRSIALAAIAAAVLGGTTYRRGRGTPEDTVVIHFRDAPAVGVPEVGLKVPDVGTLDFLFATGHAPGVGAGTITYSAVRADAGVACSLEVPCTLAAGSHVPDDGSVQDCTATVEDRELLEFEVTADTCASQPDVFIQTTFTYQ